MTSPTNDTRSLDDVLEQILMSYQKHIWHELEHHYPVTNQKSLSRKEAISAINALTLRQVLELVNNVVKAQPTWENSTMIDAESLLAELRQAAIEKWGEKK